MRLSEAKPKGSKSQTEKGTMSVLRGLFGEREETRDPRGLYHYCDRGRAKSGGGGSISGKGKQRETLPPVLPVPLEAPGNGNGEGREQRYEPGLLPSGRQLSVLPGAELHEPESAVQDRPRYVQKNKSREASSKEAGPLPQAPLAPVDHLSYDHAEGAYFPSYFGAGPSSASDIACEGGQSLSSP
jgi:hypothetical protein